MNMKAERDIYTVARLNSEARMLLEAGLPALWVEGEISNFACPASGHWYFTLKDRDAQIRCAMFRARNSQVGFRPRDGQQMMVRGKVSLYEPRGDYQLIAEAMEDAGEGALRREFEKLKARLQAEGLFDPALKRPLPTMPRRIAVVTSHTGAAVRDVLHILARRFPPAEVLVFATPVQGAAATPAIVAALDAASARGDCDVIILARGGGSIEDLWCFNDERVARAIRRAAIPVVTGIGHEIDFTIADFAADVRAPTPSGAAEIVVPDRATLLGAVRGLAGRLQQAAQRQLRNAAQRHEQLLARLQRAHPGSRLQQQVQRLDDLDLRLRRAWDTQRTRLMQRLQLAQRHLDAISPLATLQRGYAIVTGPGGDALLDESQVKPGDVIEARVARGRIRAQVVETSPERR
ncbi:MAG: exodeoxyribonuclease VII large subunit [Proteobacteria bacterium]|nr:exodeoxyribonuclease VII large subunit [Pseudomonadota bacterium]